MTHGRVAFEDVATRDVLGLVLRGCRPEIDLPHARAGFASIITASWVQCATARPTMAAVLESLDLLIEPPEAAPQLTTVSEGPR
jgi:hypothetical protein